MTNREYIINLLLDGLENEADFKRESIDDGLLQYCLSVLRRLRDPKENLLCLQGRMAE
nr:MAG TPA: hypothetical protein [Caudoviricetes sp.]